MSENEKLLAAFLAGMFVGLMILGGLIYWDNNDLKWQGIELLENDTEVRVLMDTSTKVIQFATDTGYILYDGDRLYVEMDRCGPLELEGE